MQTQTQLFTPTPNQRRGGRIKLNTSGEQREGTGRTTDGTRLLHILRMTSKQTGGTIMLEALLPRAPTSEDTKQAVGTLMGVSIQNYIARE